MDNLKNGDGQICPDRGRSGLTWADEVSKVAWKLDRWLAIRARDVPPPDPAWEAGRTVYLGLKSWLRTQSHPYPRAIDLACDVERLRVAVKASQEPLGAEFEKVLHDNLWGLYAR